MRKFLSLTVMCSLAFPAMALAEEPEAPKQAADDMKAEYGEGPAPEPATSAEHEMPEPPKMAADDMGEEYAGEEPAEGEHPFLDGLSWQVMASAFYMFNGRRVAGVYNDIIPDPADRFSYPYTNAMGFGLNFVGGMINYTGDKFGVTVDLRWGSGADDLTPLVPVKQGYVSYIPTDKLTLDFGFFDTVFGAEVADEWENANYTRGALYFLRQPFNHMGVRMGAELADAVGFTLMLTNGGVLGGTPVDDNEVPAVGWQFGFAPGDVVGLYIGGNHAPSGSNGNKDWESFFDFVLSVNVEWFTLLLNGDYQVNPHGIDPTTGGAGELAFQYGHSLALIFDVTDQWSVGLRGEHLSGNEFWRDFGNNSDNVMDGLADSTFGYLWTTTATIRYKPVEYLVLSLEGRLEGAGEDVYFSRDSPTDVDGIVQPDKDIYYGLILGVSGHIGN